jgi:hypothetical protein
VAWFDSITKKAVKQLERDVEENPLDRIIVEKGTEVAEVEKVYQARWVWYHTILAIEIFCTNLLLMIIVIMLGLIIGKL